jgi:hypothetical protein
MSSSMTGLASAFKGMVLMWLSVHSFGGLKGLPLATESSGTGLNSLSAKRFASCNRFPEPFHLLVFQANRDRPCARRSLCILEAK